MLGNILSLLSVGKLVLVSVCVSVCACVVLCCSSPLNGDLAIAGEASAKLCMSLLMIEVQAGLWAPTLSSLEHAQPSCGALVPSPGGFALH